MHQAQTNRGSDIKSANNVISAIVANRAARMPVAVAGLALTAFMVGALMQSGQRAAQSRPIPISPKNVSKSVHTVKPVVKSVAPAVTTTAGRRNLAFYTGDVRAGMFSEPVAPAPPTPHETVSVRSVAPAPVDPFADWNYTGTATIGDDKVAILENVNTHDGVLLHVGDKFLGTKVADISGSLLTFGAGKTSKSLFVSMNTSYVPLNASAGFLTAKPEPAGGPGSNNVQALLMSMLKGNTANAAPAGGPSVTLPNGTVLSGNALTRYNRRLNRGWNTTAAPAGR